MKNMSIFPNPSHDELNITLSGANQEQAWLLIVDIKGNLVGEDKNFLIGSTYNVSALSHGNYYVCLIHENRNYVKPFIKN